MQKIKDMLFGMFLVLIGATMVLMFGTGLVGEVFVYIGVIAALIGAIMVCVVYFTKE